MNPASPSNTAPALFTALLFLTFAFHLPFDPWDPAYLPIGGAELVLLSGSWLLARLHLRSALGAGFVAAAAAGSAAGLDAEGSNLFPIAALPLLLWLLHGVLEEGSGPKLLLALALTGAQALLNPPETALVTPLAAALVLAAQTSLRAYPLRDRLRALDFRRLFFPAGIGLLFLALALAGALAGGRAEPPSLHRFLAASTLGRPLDYLDLAAGLAPRSDVSLFAGFFTLALSATAAAGLGRATLLRLLGWALLGALVLGAVAAAVPPASPLPVAAAAGPIRLLIIFLAGIGLDRLAEGRPGPVGAAGAGLAIVAVALGALSVGAEQSHPAVEALLGPRLSQSLWIPELLAASMVGAGTAAALLLLRQAVPRAAPVVLALLMVLHPLDVFGWKFRTAWLRRGTASVEVRAR